MPREAAAGLFGPIWRVLAVTEKKWRGTLSAEVGRQPPRARGAAAVGLRRQPAARRAAPFGASRFLLADGFFQPLRPNAAPESPLPARPRTTTTRPSNHVLPHRRSSSRPSRARPSRSTSSRATRSTTSSRRSRTRRASRPTSSASSSRASSSRTAARSRTTTSRRSRPYTWSCACAAACRSSSRP